MKRREALKNIGLSFGAIAMSSTVVGLVQSCSSGATWNPKFFSIDESEIVAKTLDLILPATPNIPGAKDLNLTQFIDGYIHLISGENEQKGIKEGIGVYLSTTLESSGKRNSSKLTSKDIDDRLTFYLKADAAQQKTWEVEAAEASKNTRSNPSVDAVNFRILNSLRSRAISAFKITEQIGENVLAYDPIPGEQKGCVDLQATTQGKAWSL